MASRASLELFSPVEVSRTADAVLEQLVDLIRSGKLQQGQLLPGERQLAVSMAVSRRTIRDAIEILAVAGVLSVAAGSGGGWRLTSIWVPDDVVKALSPLQVERTFMILEARRAIEPRVALLASARGTEQDYAVMKETITLQRANQGDWVRTRQANARFHRQLWRAGGNRELEDAMRSIYRKLGGIFEAVLTADEPASVGIEIHEATLAAVMRGNAAEIDEVMDVHLGHVEHLAERWLGRARIRALPGFLTNTKSGAPVVS